MKKWSKQWTVRLGGLALAPACLGTGVALAAGGDQSDPLVTVSYLEQTAIPGVVTQVEEKAAARQEELKKELESLIAQYKQDVEGLGGTGTGSATFTLVTLSSGQTMDLNVGCEVLLRIGSVTVSAADSPALIDMSTGGTLSSGSALQTNHLYMATIADRTLTPTTGTVKLLVRGSYSVA